MLKNKLFLLFILFAFLSSCFDPQKQQMSSSGGGTSEILVVMEKHYWEKESGKAIKDYLGQFQYGLNQEEPIFKLINIPEASLNDIYKKHRNLLWVDIDKSKAEKFELKKDVWSQPQSIFKFSAPSEEAFIRLFQDNKESVMEGFKESERERINSAFKPSVKIEHARKMDKLFGFNLAVPKSFYWAKEDENFLWLRKETKDFSQAIVIYTKLYTDTADLSKESLIAFRDSSLKKHIQGTEINSYMGTETNIAPQTRKIIFNDMYAIEMRGFWRQYGGGFMGGPFLSYSFVDENTGRLISIEGYVQYPNENKRDLLLQLEAILHTFKFAEEESKE